MKRHAARQKTQPAACNSRGTYVWDERREDFAALELGPVDGAHPRVLPNLLQTIAPVAKPSARIALQQLGGRGGGAGWE